MIRFLETAFPEFQVRGEGKNQDGLRWVHIGTNETYIALSPANAQPEKRWVPYRGLPGVNHLAGCHWLRQCSSPPVNTGKASGTHAANYASLRRPLLTAVHGRSR